MPDLRALWTSGTLSARVVRVALLPAAALFRSATAVRGALYGARILRSVDLGAPAVSVGNLTVGGTGKTTIASWIAQELSLRGARPGILLRGYGGDEAQVHEFLSPAAIVVADADRARGARNAIARGADALVLDDAFQHRRVRRDVDIVLLSADAQGGVDWPLPAGPWRESVSSLKRASLALVTRKAASPAAVERLLDRIAQAAPGVATGVARLELREIAAWGSKDRLPIGQRSGQTVLAISAIGDPAAFEAQLRDVGMKVTAARFPDHHRFGQADVAALSARAGRSMPVLCTLKDAVKLGPLWPLQGPPLWYLSQRVIIERGEGLLAGLLAGLVAARGDSGPAPALLPKL